MTTLTHSLSVRNVSKSFGHNSPLVLDQIDLEIAPGEFVCLLGASGCGKTTLLNILAGLDAPTSGEVSTSERPTLMFQESALMPWLTAGRNIELALQARGVPRSVRRERATELLKLVRLERAQDKRPHELSGGMKQRVAIARALAQEKSILLMDEPFAALDAITRDFLHDELQRLWEQTGVSILFVTHNVREAVRLGQRVLLMSSRPGRILREWQVDIPQPRTIDSPEVAELAHVITSELREEIRRHAR